MWTETWLQMKGILPHIYKMCTTGTVFDSLAAKMCIKVQRAPPVCQSLLLFGAAESVWAKCQPIKCLRFKIANVAVISLPLRFLGEAAVLQLREEGVLSEKMLQQRKNIALPHRKKKWQAKSSTGPLRMLVSTRKAVEIKIFLWLGKNFRGTGRLKKPLAEKTVTFYRLCKCHRGRPWRSRENTKIVWQSSQVVLKDLTWVTYF